FDHQHAHGISRLTRIRAPLRKLSEKREFALWPPVARSAIRPRYLHIRVDAGDGSADVRARPDHAGPSGGGVVADIRPKLEREGLPIAPSSRWRWSEPPLDQGLQSRGVQQPDAMIHDH